MDAAVVSLVGREEELRLAHAALAGTDGGAVVFRGEAGIGKTTLWEAATAAGVAAGRRVLVARPVEAERRLALVSFADLLQPVAEEVLPELPGPQRRALEAALLLADFQAGSPDPRTLGAALVSALGILGGGRGAVLAVDDFQWVDNASRGPLEFALRRLGRTHASAVLAIRTGEPDNALPPLDRDVPVSIVDVGPLSLGALQRLLLDRLDDGVSRPLLRRVHAASGGNPLYALEIARALQDAGPVSAHEELPVPSDLDGLLRKRVGALPPRTRRALAAAAALAEPRVEWVEQEGDLQPALDADVVRADRGIVRFSHPLLASAAYALLAPRRRRELHTRLAEVMDDVEQRARHLAVAHPGPDDSVAALLEAAAERALARGAPLAAGELFELALTRTVDADRVDVRRMGAAQAYWRAGEFAAARPLAERAVEALPPGPQRAHALVLLSTLTRDDLPTATVLAQQAWEEAEGDPAAEALAATVLSYLSGVSGDSSDALAHARRALDRADALQDATLAAVVADAVFIQMSATGRADRGLLARGLAAEERAGGISDRREVRSVLAMQLLLEERYEEARAELETTIAVVEAHGYESRLHDLLNLLSEIETRSGRPAVGAAVAARADETRALLGMDRVQAMLGYFSAFAAAYLGQVDEVRALTKAGLAAAAEAGDRAFGAAHAAAVGFLEFSLGNAEAAVEVLAPLAEQLATIAPGMHPMQIPVLPNLIEALIAVGRHDEARVHLERLEARGRELDSAWALSQAARARGLLAAADGNLEVALVWFEAALEHHERTGKFERARTLLARGAVMRRARKWRAARESLNAALAIFEEMGAALWADKARGELGRIGGRRASHGLTPTEERIAQLVAAGRSNKEIANDLFVTVHTIETHLTSVYAKLGVHSRSQLAHVISSELRS